MFTRLHHIVFAIPVSGVYTNPAAALSLEFIICVYRIIPFSICLYFVWI